MHTNTGCGTNQASSICIPSPHSLKEVMLQSLSESLAVIGSILLFTGCHFVPQMYLKVIVDWTKTWDEDSVVNLEMMPQANY